MLKPLAFRTPSVILVLMALVSLFSGCQQGAPPESAAATEGDGAAVAEAGPTLSDALQKFRQQDVQGAHDVLLQITAREPENIQAWSYLATVRHQLKQYDEAGDALRKILEIDGENQNAWYGLAGLAVIQEDPDEAFRILERLKASGKYDYSQLTIDPSFAPLQTDPRFDAFRMKPEDFADPFVEDVRIVHEWRGEAGGDEFGWVARNIGDVDGDGIDDVVTSAPSKNIEGANAGRIYAYSGKSGQELWRASGQPGDRLGVCVEEAGDVDGDGTPDVVAGAPAGNHALVFSGRDGSPIHRLAASQEGASFGNSVRGVGDVDGDRHADVIVGAPQNGTSGPAAGRAAVYSGKSGELLHEWFGEAAGHRFGSVVAGRTVGEQTFLMVGAPDAGDNQGGRVYVYDALTDTPRYTIESDAKGAELGSMFLSVVGDVNADGIPDLYASDWSHGAKGLQTGRIVVHSGADGSNLLTLDGEAARDGFGIGPADVGDVDGDGHDDLLVGAWQHASAAPGGGRVYLHSGKDGSLMRTFTGKVMGETFGFDATGMGDVDGDGKIDYLLTAAWSAVQGAKSGRVYIVAGE